MITINQSPTFPNIANNDLIWVVESTEISQPQYQFVVDIKDENDVLIQRVKQQPNPQGYGVFNLKNIISNQFDNVYTDDELTWYNFGWQNAPIPSQKYLLSYTSNGATKQFNVYFGEEYAVSTTATSSLYDGEGSLGNPAVSVGDDWQIYMNGVLDTNDRFPLWSGSWNFTSQYDSFEVDANTLPLLDDNDYWNLIVPTQYLPFRSYAGKGKWNPMRMFGAENAYNINYIEIDANNPASEIHTHQVGLTDFPATRKVYWDDMGTISYLQGTTTSPQAQLTQSSEHPAPYFPKGQFFRDGSITWYYSDGTKAYSTLPINRDLTLKGTYGNFISEVRYSQSVDETMLHTPMFPSNFIYTTNAFRNPIDNPNNYTTKYEIRVEPYKATNKVGWTNNYIYGSARTGFEAPEFGSYSYSPSPVIIMDATETFATGSYPSSTAKAWFRGTTGGDCMVHFTQSDALYSGTGYPMASAIQVVNDINTQLEASGSSVRAWLIDNPFYPNAMASEQISEPWAKYQVMVADTTNDYGSYNALHVLQKSGEGDAFGTYVVGENSCLGIGTGNYNLTIFATSEPVSTTYYLSGSVSYYSVYDTRTFEVDWCGFEGLSSDNIVNEYPRKQFMWKNKYGALDYYTFTLAETITNDIERQQYEQSFVNYNSTSLLPFDKSRRGTTQYYNKITQRHIIESDWLTQEEADAVKELFFSTTIFEIQKQNQTIIASYDWFARDVSKQNVADVEYAVDNTIGTDKNYDFPMAQTNEAYGLWAVEKVPVVITNAQLIEKTNPRTQKLYKISAEFIYANDLKARV